MSNANLENSMINTVKEKQKDSKSTTWPFLADRMLLKDQIFFIGKAI